MTTEHLPKRFYRLIYFSPRPEDGERVCVAIVVWDEGKTHYLFDEKVRKARNLSRDYPPEAIRFVLERLEGDVERIAHTGSVPEFSPQFQVSEPRTLLKPMDTEVRNLLLQTYLSPQKGYRSPAKQAGLSRRIEQFLSGLNVPSRFIMRRASAEQLLGENVVRRLPVELVPGPVTRVVNFADKLVLMEGVDVHSATSGSLVDHVGRIVHTYWQYKKAKEYLSNDRLNVTSAAIVFDGEGSTENDKFTWRREYATEQFKKDADLTISPSAPSGEENLRHLLISAGSM